MSASTLIPDAPLNRRWLRQVELQAFRRGWIRASKGKSRVCPSGPFSYNQRAAFMDGWDSFHEQGSHRRRRKPPGASGNGLAASDVGAEASQPPTSDK